MVGYPGSGKSTYAHTHFKNELDKLTFRTINQDTLGNRQSCINLFKTYLELGIEHIVIDRTNVSMQQRAYWIDIARSYGVQDIKCVYLWIQPVDAIHRIKTRINHPTIPNTTPSSKIEKIVNMFVKQFEFPTPFEGFNEILIKVTE